MGWARATPAEIAAAAAAARRDPRAGWRQVRTGRPPRPGPGWVWNARLHRWVRRPGRGGVGSGAVVDVGGVGSGAYSGASDADIEAQANAQADRQIGVSQAEILRQQAAAHAMAERDVKTLSGLGSAQMAMIGQIPANIQAIRSNAAHDIEGFGGQVAAGEQAQLAGEQDANADFTATQVGDTAAGPTSFDPAKAAAATKALGGDIPATSQAEIGAASAIAASGMPAVVARGTQEQVAQRLGQAATEDADYRQQLVSLAATRGGIYMDALNGLYDIESKKFGRYEAQQRLELDKKQFELQKRAELANEKISGIKVNQDTRALDLRESELRLKDAKQQADLQAAMDKGAKPSASLSKVYGFVVDANGNAILDKNGKRIPVAKTTTTTAGKAAQMQKATKEAASMRQKGKPVQATKGRGQYVTADRFRNVNGPNMYPDGTTDNPDYAKVSGRMSFAQAQNYLMQAYGLSKAEARKVLKSAGW